MKALFPRNADEVVSAVEFAKKYGLKISIKNSGHSYSDGASTRAGTLLLNMRKKVVSSTKQFTSIMRHLGGSIMRWVAKLQPYHRISLVDGEWTECGEDIPFKNLWKAVGGGGGDSEANDLREDDANKFDPVTAEDSNACSNAQSLIDVPFMFACQSKERAQRKCSRASRVEHTFIDMYGSKEDNNENLPGFVGANHAKAEESIYGTVLLKELEAIKQEVDPSGIFTCQYCVGDTRLELT
ncbi:hypothetical protein THAOC_09657 [Thalassiosira oceanica]|uniref:FAD linked oxidase N-terminal domain-containing protein n=1 Tax=Thalassiosira oceanica TaxID=159749 RepID=K0SW03_THAOC|nr:hypothetical protein THAOC_09657 [Thalassiosira oceanica]|eukprot:EJK69124.1 hypothetical protein THAOC_09657 [Thalassiosira oceanica]